MSVRLRFQRALLGFLFPLLVLWLPTGVHAGDGGPLRISAMSGDIPLVSLFETVMRHAYREIGHEVEFAYAPPRRALRNAGTGRMDAELFRIGGVEKLYPELVPVQVSIHTVEVVAYTLQAGMPVETCGDLADYRVGVLRGILLMERCASVGTTVHAAHSRSLAQMLTLDRVDLILVERRYGELSVQPAEPRAVLVSEQPLLREEIFHYLHHHHANLAAPLAAALRHMKENGELAQMREAWWSAQRQELGRDTLATAK